MDDVLALLAALPYPWTLRCHDFKTTPVMELEFVLDGQRKVHRQPGGTEVSAEALRNLVVGAVGNHARNPDPTE